MKFFGKITLSRFHISTRIVLSDYFLGLAAFSILRFCFLLFNHSSASQVPTSLLAASMWRGIQFDSVACGMILIFPWLISFFGMVWRKQGSIFIRVSSVLTTFFFTLAFFAAFVDIPLFTQFEKRLSVAALHWTSSPGFILKLVFSQVKTILLLMLFLAFSYLFYRIRKKIAKKIVSSGVTEIAHGKSIIVALLYGGLLLLAIRGRISIKSPIRWGTAYFCDNNFANQTVLNPFYTFVSSLLQSSNGKEEYRVMKDADAERIFQNNINRNSVTRFSIEPSIDSLMPKRNVVLVIMESMAGWKTGLYPNGLKRTNHLDSLAKTGIFFSRFYSDGIHTFNGLYATLTGSQCLPKIHPLNDINVISNPVTIAELLKGEGYATVFFTTHDVEFDNMNGFMRGNGFDEMIGESDYSFSTGINPMGVPDHVLFDFAEKKINTIAGKGKPFFATLLTGSDHDPFLVPENSSFGKVGNDDHENATRYADWSIGKFMQACKKESWYANTIFVFVADHGGIPLGHPNDMYLAFHHIPCIILGAGIPPMENNSLGTQADILPTLMGILQLDYPMSTMGIDLFRDKRKNVFFSYDQEVCALDSNSFYVDRPIDSHLFLLNEMEYNCVRAKDAARIKQKQDFISAMLQLMEERFYGKLGSNK